MLDSATEFSVLRMILTVGLVLLIGTRPHADEPSWCKTYLESIGRSVDAPVPEITGADLAKFAKVLDCPEEQMLFMYADIKEARYVQPSSTPKDFEGHWVSDNLLAAAFGTTSNLNIEFLEITAIDEERLLIRQFVARRSNPLKAGFHTVPTDLADLTPQLEDIQPLLAEITIRLEENGMMTPIKIEHSGTLLDRDRTQDLVQKLMLLSVSLGIPLSVGVEGETLAFGHRGGQVRNADGLRTYRKREPTSVSRAQVVIAFGSRLQSDFYCLVHEIDVDSENHQLMLRGKDADDFYGFAEKMYWLLEERRRLGSAARDAAEGQLDNKEQIRDRLAAIENQISAAASPEQWQQLSTLLAQSSGPLNCLTLNSFERSWKAKQGG